MPNVYLNVSRGGGLIRGIFATQRTGTLEPVGGSSLGEFTYGENNTFYVVPFDKFYNIYNTSSTTAVTWNISFGYPALGPNRGEFRLGDGSTTGTAVSYNATTTQLKNAISGVYGNITVATYGATVTAGYLITAATANTALTINGQSLSLTPSSTVDVLNLVTHSSGVTAQSLVKLRRSPMLSLTGATTARSIPVPSVTGTGAGPFLLLRPEESLPFSIPMVIEMSVTAPSGGLSSTTIPTTLMLGPSGDRVLEDFFGQENGAFSRRIKQKFLTATTNFGSARLPVSSAASYTGPTQYGQTVGDFFFFDVSSSPNGFVINVTPKHNGISVTGMTSRASVYGTLNPAAHHPGVITFTGADLDEAFLEARRTVITPTLEVCITEESKKQVLVQTPVTIRRNIL